jgi:hypothetical protein
MKYIKNENEKQRLFEDAVKHEKGVKSIIPEIKDIIEEKNPSLPTSEQKIVLSEILTDIYSDKSRLHKLVKKDNELREYIKKTIKEDGVNFTNRNVKGLKNMMRTKALPLQYGIIGLGQGSNRIENYEDKIEEMLTEVIRRYSSDKGLETTTTLRDRKEYTDESKDVNEMLGKFEDYAGRKLTYRNVFTNKNKLDVKTASLSSGTLTQPQIDNYLLTIDNLNADEKSTLRPIREILRQYSNEKKGGRFTINIDKVDIIGDLDFKSLQNRKDVYAFWKEKHGEYKDFEKAYLDFISAIEGIEGIEGDLKDAIKDLKSYSNEITNGELNYIRAFKPMQVESHKKANKHVALFNNILDENGLLVQAEKEFENESDGGSITVNTYGKDDERTGITEEVSSSQGKGKLDQQRLITLGRVLDGIEKIEVDPIYYVEYNDKAFKEPTPVFETEVKRLEKLLLIEGEKYEAAMNTNIDFEIIEYIKRLKELASDVSEDGKYFLPLTKTTMSKLVQGEGKGSDKNIKYIIGFLKAFSKLFEPDDFKSVAPSKTGTKPYGGKGGDPTQTSELIRPVIENLGNVASENEYEKLENVKEELDELLIEVSNFFITPMYSTNLPFDDNFGLDVDGLEKRIFRIIESHNPNESVFSYVMSEDKTKGYTKYEPRHIKELTAYLTFISTPSKIQNIRKLVDGIKEGRNLVIRIANLDRRDKITKEGVNEEFGNILHNILTKNNLMDDYKIWAEESKKNPQGKFPNSNGKTPKEWAEKYNQNKIYPLNYIIKEIYNNRGSLEQMDSQGGRSSIIYEFVDIVESLRNKQEDVVAKMLEAHDNIRKMVGKPIYYNTSSLSNFNHVNAAIDIMKSDYNVDVSAYEISSIVNEVDSFGEIGIKHGVPKESVYFLKANFR